MADLERVANNFGNSTSAAIERIKASSEQAKSGIAQIADQMHNLDVASSGTAAKLADADKKLDDFNATVQTSKKGIAGLADAEKAQREVLNTLINTLQKLDAQYKALDPTEKGYGTRKRQIASDLKTVNSLIKAQSSALISAKRSIDSAVGSYDHLNKQTGELWKQLRALPDAFDRNTGAINKNNRAAVDLYNQIGKNEAALKRFDAGINRHQRNVGNYGSALEGLASGGLTGFLGKMGLVGLVIQQAVGPIKEAIGIMDEMDRLDASLKAVSRDSEDFAKSQQFLIGLSTDLGQNYAMLVKTFKSLKAATKDTSLEGKSTELIFQGIIKAGSALQLSNEEVEGSLYAITQIVSKSKVSMEELRQQLAEKMPGAMRILAEAMGISEMQLNKLVENGKLYAKDVLPKLAEGLEKVYGKDAQKNVETMGGQWNILNTEVALFLKSLNEDKAITGFFARMTAGLSSVMRQWRSLRQIQDGGGLGTMMGATLEGWFGINGQDSARVNAATQRQKTMSAFPNQSPEQRSKTITDLQRQFLALTKKQYDENNGLSSSEQRGLAAQTLYLEGLIDDLKKLNTTTRRADRRSNERAEAAAAREEAEQAKMEAEANKKKADAAKKKANTASTQEYNRKQSEAVSKTRKNIDASNDNMQTDLAAAKADHEAGLLLDEEYEKRKYEIVRDGLNARRRILHAGTQSQYKDVRDLSEDGLREVNKLEEKAQGEYLQGRLEAEKKAFKKLKDAIKDGAKEIESTQDNQLRDSLTKLTEDFEDTENEIRKKVLKREYTAEQGETYLHNLRNNYLEDTLKATEKAANAERNIKNANIEAAISGLEKWKAAAIRTPAEIAEVERQIDELRKQQKDNDRDAEDKKNKEQSVKRRKQTVEDNRFDAEQDERAAKRKQELIQRIGDLSSQAGTALFDVSTAYRDRDLAELEKQKDNELQLVGDNKDAQAKIEEEYNKKVAAIKKKQAIADREQALFNIAISTAQGVASVLATGGGTHYADFGISAGLLSAFVIASGAIQAAAVLAKPLPAYKDGKKSTNSYAGPAIAGEAGAELWFHGSQATYLDRPTVINTKRGDTVVPAAETAAILASIGRKKFSPDQELAAQASLIGHLQEGRHREQQTVVVNAGLSKADMEEAFGRALDKRPVDQTIIDENGFSYYEKRQASRIKYRQNRNSFR